ncbi:hypothetical protein [Candidatus Mesenet endosymbiont of Agriotes lineatus]|uniref:hypothetical protein n=1 Tax=Candidatus Mesenet endosymbiont of Agriotes lineatus TaxID=3077948 RepID=UPI0030CCA4F5
MEFNKYISGTTLNISKVKLTLKDIQHLVRFLQKNSYIIQLNLFSNKIGVEGAKALAKLTNLTSLDLRFDYIGDEGAKALAKLTNLTSLDLEFNYIGDEGAKALAKLTNLTSLDLRSNKIGVEGAKALAKLTNLTFLDLIDNEITLKQKEELIEALAALKLDGLNQSENSSLFGNTMLRKFYNYLKGLPSKTDEELYRNGVKEMIFTLARHDDNGTTIKHILTYSNKYPFLINSRNKDGHKLSHFYTHSPDMQKFLFEHGLIPEPKEQDKRLQNIITDNQSVHNNPVVKKTNFIVKELVKSSKASQDELKQAADFYLADIPKLLQQYKDDQIRVKLLSITEDEKRSVMEKTLHENVPVPSDQQFVEAVMSKAKETLKIQYLRKKATGEYDHGYPTTQMQYDYTKDDAKVTIPQSIGYIKLLIDGFDIPLNERKELLVTLAEQNPKLIERKLSYIRSELENDDITQEQVTKRSEFHKLLNDTEDKNKIDKLFEEISGLDLKEIWKEQKRFVLAKQIYVAATTYGENSSACIQGTWSQIVNSISEIDLGLADKYEQYLAKERKKEKQREVITAKNIGEFEEYLGNQLIQYAKDHPELKEPLLDFALVMVDVEKSEEIMLEQQQILAKINQEFSSKIKEYLPNYGRDIPTLQEYKIIVDEIANVSSQKIQQFIDNKKAQIKLMIDNPINQEQVENDTVNKEENLEQHIHLQNTNVVTDKPQAEIKITNSAIKSPVVDNNTRGQTLVSSVKIVNSNKSQQISPIKKAIYTTMTVSPFIAVGIYAAVALSMAGVVFNPVVAAGIFISVAALAAICFAIVKICEKVSEEKGKNSGVSSCIVSNGGVVPGCLKGSEVAIS